MQSAHSITVKVALAVLIVIGTTWQTVLAAASPAQTTTASISGTVVDRDGSIPISGAMLELDQGTTKIASATADKFGNFSFPSVMPGTYTILVRATGYGTVRSDAIPISSGPLNLTLVMQRTQTATAVKTIGRITVTSHPAGLQTTTTIQAAVDPQLAQRTNHIRVAESLGSLPEVNLIGLDSAVGDDIAVDVRGLKPSETQIMLDGHPIGPLGVYPGSIGGGSGGYDLQDSPLGSIESTLVTYGSGAVGLYGVDAIGGSVDMQTLNPTIRPEGMVQYGFGSYDKQLFGAAATGTSDKLGYAIDYGVTGTTGDFPGAIITQSGTRGTNWDPVTTQGITYWVDGAYNLRNFLGKVRYSFTPNTTLTLTAYTATSWDNKTGNGDNDFITPEFAQLTAQNNSNCTTPGGKPGITVRLSPANVTPAVTECVTPQQYGAFASGPAGGGGLAWQALANQDYHARFATNWGKNAIIADWFADNYSQNKNRGFSFLNGPLSITNPVYRTFAGLISDDIASDKNDFGFGYYQQRQYTAQNAVNGGPPVFTTSPTLFDALKSYFIRDAWTPSQQLQFFLNAWEKNSNIGGWSFDPRMSIVYRPEAADVIRVTGGYASADAAPLAASISSIGGITPGNCQTIGVGTVPTNGTLPERASDEELSLAHRWVADTITDFTAYDTNERNTIFEANIPAAPYESLLLQYGGPNFITDALAHVNSLCGNPTPPLDINNLVVTTNTNLANARARGMELDQRWRIVPHVVFDGYWDTQSVTFFDAPTSLLQNNVTFIPGSQLPRIPLHQWGAYIDVTTDKGGDLYLKYSQVDSNNELNRPSYGSADLAITQEVGPHTFLNLGVSNLFNQAVDTYGRIGYGVFIPENQFGTDTSGLQQGTERFGLAPASVSFTVIERY
jgi:outer membrane receptor for ferrienterochelin and colicin